MGGYVLIPLSQIEYMADSDLPGHTLAQYLKAVAKVAKSDGKVTEDEYNILKQLSFDVAQYTMTLEDAEKDGIIDQQERSKLEDLKSKLLENATEIANQDGVISDDEAALLDKLAEILDA